MSNISDVRVKCGNCHQYHASVNDVRSCYFPPIIKLCMTLTPHEPHWVRGPKNVWCPGAPVSTPAAVEQSAPAAPSNRATQRQLDYIRDLGGDVETARNYTMRDASLYIERLKEERRKAKMNETAPNRRQTKIPLPMLIQLRDGYYASRLDSTRPYVFFRVSRPKSGRYKGAIKIQTQHGPELKMALEIWKESEVYWTNMSVEEQLLLVVVDPNGCSIAYAEEIGHCMRCNTELTDERSRWFGIGPECEKHWPHIIDLVADRKGPFVPGWEAR